MDGDERADDVEFEEDSVGEIANDLARKNCDMELGMALSASMDESRVQCVLDPIEVQRLVDRQLEKLLEEEDSPQLL
jgi:hypothetical protein